MKVWFRELWSQIVVALVTGVPLSILTGVASQVFAGDWRKWFGFVPWWAYLSVVVAILVVTSIRAYNVAARKVAAEKYLPRKHRTDCRWLPVGECDHAGVRWQVVAREFRNGERVPEGWRECWDSTSLGVIEKPYCSKCATEIVERANWLQYMVWRCPRRECGWRSWSTYSFETVAHEADSVGRRDVISKLQKGGEHKNLVP